VWSLESSCPGTFCRLGAMIGVQAMVAAGDADLVFAREKL
jgi:hypothetical protein